MPDSATPSSQDPSAASAGFDFGAFACLMEKETGAGLDPNPADLPAPAEASLRRFGDYLIESEIARGGMGVVYQATQISLERKVAIKMLRDSAMAGSQEVERFRREATAVATLRHRNIVGIHEIAEHEGTHYFSMEYVPGLTLAQLLAQGPVAPRHAAAIMVKIAHAIHHAHSHGVLHRDLKPSNVIMDGEAEPMITDFGLAKNDTADQGLTLSGQVLGTPAYMAPEQASGKSRLASAATDVYGLGALLYHLLSGRPPFSGPSHLAIMQQVMSDDPLTISLLTPAVSPDLDTLCAKAMAKEPARRYDSALDFARDLERFLEGKPVLARPLSGPARLWRWARRHPGLAASLAGIGLLLATVAIGSTIAAQRLSVSQREAGQARDLARDNEVRTKRHLYASDMRIAMENWNRGELSAMKERLAAHLPGPGEEDLRTFEWHMLNTLSQGEQTRLTELPGKPTSAAFTPDGAYVVFSIGTQTHLWDATAAVPLFQWMEIPPDLEVSYRMLRQVSPHLLACAWQTGLWLIDQKTRSVRVLDPNPCESLALSTDGSRLAVASRFPGNARPPQVRILDTATWSVVREIPVECRGLDWTADGQLIVLSVAHDGPRDQAGHLQWYDPGGPEPVKQSTIQFTSLVRLALLDARSDRAYVMLECLDDHLVELSTGRDLRGQSSSAFQQCAANPEFEWLAHAGQDPTVRLQQLPTWGVTINPRRGHTDRVLGLACLGTSVAYRSISSDGTLRDWDFQMGRHDYVLGITQADARTAALALSPGTGRYVGMLEEWCGQNGLDKSNIFDRELHEITHSLEGAVMALSSDGKQAMGLQKNQLRHYDLSTPAHANITILLTFADQPVAWLPRISQDWQRIAWTPDDKATILTEVSTGRQIGRYPEVAGVPSFSPDGSTLAIPQQTILLVNALTGAATDTGFPCGPLLAWSADGRRIAALKGNDILIYDLAQERAPQHLQGHRGNIGSIAWTPDGRSLAVGCDDNTLLFWNLATSRPTAEVTLNGGPFLLGFTQDSSALIAGTMKGYRILRAVPWLPPP